MALQLIDYNFFVYNDNKEYGDIQSCLIRFCTDGRWTLRIKCCGQATEPPYKQLVTFHRHHT